MDITGKIIHTLEEQSGEGKNGKQWRKRDYVIETSGEYPKKVCFTLWGERIDQYKLQDGEEVKADIEIESREYNGKWYTNIKAWKLEKTSGITAADGIDAPAPAALDDAPPPPTVNNEAEQEDDLPF